MKKQEEAKENRRIKKETERKDVLELLKYIRTVKRMYRLLQHTEIDPRDRRVIEAAGDDFVMSYLEQKELIT